VVGSVKRKTSLALRGIDAATDSSVVLRFAAGGQDYSWTFNAGTFDELVALALSGRLGKGKDVHFDAAKVSFEKGTGLKPGAVRIAIGRKVRIVAPLPAAGGLARAGRKAAGETPVRRTRTPKKSPAA
jgi:hypothetical protein